MIHLNLICLVICAMLFGAWLTEPDGTPYRRFWVAWFAVLTVFNGAVVAVAL